jgi:hypothetical protein
MSASKDHDLIVALIARAIKRQGFDIVALEGSLDWLFGKTFRLPPAITLHRPDILGVRNEPPYLCIGEAKTCGDLRSTRTRRQLLDFSQAQISDTGMFCLVNIGVPQDCEAAMNQLISSLGIQTGRVTVMSVPRALLTDKHR